jgi:hypothetical protein
MVGERKGTKYSALSLLFASPIELSQLLGIWACPRFSVILNAVIGVGKKEMRERFE